MLSSARTAAAAITAPRSWRWLGGRHGNSLLRGSVGMNAPTPITMRRFQNHSTDAVAESGNKQVVPKSAMDNGGGESGDKKNQENMGGKSTGEKRRFFSTDTAVLGSLIAVGGSLINSFVLWQMQDNEFVHESAEAKLKRAVETFKKKIGGKFEGPSNSLLPRLENGTLQHLNETCIGMDQTIKDLQAGEYVLTCIEGDTSIGKTTTLKRGLQGMNNVLYITMKHDTDSPMSIMRTALGAESGNDWREVLKVSAEEVRDARLPCITVVVDDVNTAFKSNSKEIKSILSFLMQCTDERLISLVILGSEPIEPFVNKAEISGRSRLKYVHVYPNPKFVEELAERLNWGKKLDEPLCGAVKTLFGPYLVNLRDVSTLTITYDKEVKNDPTKQDQARVQLQEQVKLAVVGVLEKRMAMLKSVLIHMPKELEANAVVTEAPANNPQKKLENKPVVVTKEPASNPPNPRPEHALLIKMLESADGVYIVDADDDTFETACKPLCDAKLVRRELRNKDARYSFSHVGVEVMAREWARSGKFVLAESPALTSERAKKQFDALKVIGYK